LGERAASGAGEFIIDLDIIHRKFKVICNCIQPSTSRVNIST